MEADRSIVIDMDSNDRLSEVLKVLEYLSKGATYIQMTTRYYEIGTDRVLLEVSENTVYTDIIIYGRKSRKGMLQTLTRYCNLHI